MSTVNVRHSPVVQCQCLVSRASALNKGGEERSDYPKVKYAFATTLNSKFRSGSVVQE